MNAAFFCPSTMFALACFFLLPAFALGAEGGSSIVQANLVFDFVADRAHLIQVSILIVVLGCACMWWSR